MSEPLALPAAAIALNPSKRGPEKGEERSIMVSWPWKAKSRATVTLPVRIIPKLLTGSPHLFYCVRKLASPANEAIGWIELIRIEKGMKARNR